ncbi:MAG: PHP domain-containing protein [Planctomycetaceae bacterium]|jgi:hypothetical protein|nr:PHP domain-containing protein [Planctomycetaceae bacterium]
MSNRREFLQAAAMLSTVAATAALPIEFVAGETGTTDSKKVDPFFAVRKNEIENPKRKPRKIKIPDVNGFKVLKGDFHIHTLFSDGLVMPQDRVREAVENGLDVISITDHIEYRIFLGGKATQLKEHNDDHNISYNFAKKEAERHNLILVRGAEITKRKMPPGHLNALFLKDTNPVADAVEDWRKMVELAVGQGAFIQWNHPGWIAPKSGGLPKGTPMSFTQDHEEIRRKGWLHGIEIFNGTEFYPIVGDWCNEKDLAVIANSDIHPSEWNKYGNQNPMRPMTLILAEERTQEAIRDAFFAKRTIGWVAGMILGRPEVVQKLFNACVEIKNNAGTLILTNKSDITCWLKIENQDHELKPQSNLTIKINASLKQFTVTNWLISTAKPLNVTING